MGFLLSFGIPVLVIASVWVGPAVGYPNAFVCLPLLAAYVVIPIVQARWPREPFQVPPDAAASPRWNAYYRVLPLLSVPVQLAMLAATTTAFVTAPLNLSGRVVLVLVTGIFGAMFAINIAHELIHRRHRFDRACGGILLSTVSFGTFKVVHLQVHHPYVGTPLDFATARRGQSIYSFWLQSFAGNFREAVRCERARLARSGKRVWSSELVVWYGLTLTWLGIAVSWHGWTAGAFFIGQSVIAVMYLDCINYLQHYGLTRRMTAPGRPEPMQDHHSWTQAMYLDDLLLFNLPRHAHHHVQPQRPFQLLKDSEHAPRYPYNYGLMTIILLFPRLFRRVAHPCLDRFEAARGHVAAV